MHLQKKNYSSLVGRVKQRTNPDQLQFKALLNESIKYPYSDVTEYIRLSMYGVPPTYTENSKKAAEKVKSQLSKSHGSEVYFKLQGSIETNTHILKDNDIDLVQISNKSSTVDRVGLKSALENNHNLTTTEYKNLKEHSDNFSHYEGNQLSDLGKLRLKSEKVLVYNYKDVDISKSKAIFVTTTNPLRKVDVVTACYYKAVPFMKTNQDYKKGIQIYDKDSDSKLAVEFPFWSIKRINDKSAATSGRLKKMIRFLKNMKYDSSLFVGKSKISSFDINAICYDIDINSYRTLHYLDLVSVIYTQINKIIDDQNYRDNLLSVDGQETIFKGEPRKVQELEYLKQEIDAILYDLNLEISRAI